MTICIAAVCAIETTIITASDRMVSLGGYFSGDDVARKIDPILVGWMSLFAGNDVSPATPILQLISEADSMPAGNTLKNVVDLCKRSYQTHRLTQIEDEVLAPYGLDWGTFREQGKSLLSERDHDNIYEQIKEFELSIEFLICGYDPKNNPHIFTINNPGKAKYYDKLGFWAIGSGQQQALSSLFSSGYSKYLPLEDCIAKVLAAKMNAETALGVGKETWLLLDKPGVQKALYIDPSVQQQFRTQWERLPKFPLGMLPIIKEHVSKQVSEALGKPDNEIADKSALSGKV